VVTFITKRRPLECDEIETMTDPLIRYADIIGQEETLARLRTFYSSRPPGSPDAAHVLILAENGMGKRTVAEALANELGGPCKEVCGSQLQTERDFTVALPILVPGKIVIIDGIHRMKHSSQEMLTRALGGGRKVTVRVGMGRRARDFEFDAQPFTLVATADKKSACSEELLSCFSLVLPLRSYSLEDLGHLAQKIALSLGTAIDPDATRLIAANSGGRPGQIEALVRRIVKAAGKDRIAVEDAMQAFADFDMRVKLDSELGAHSDLGQMSGVEFEGLVAALLSRMEFRAETTRATGDGGIDVVAVLDRPILGGKYLFQCKRYAPNNLVGASTVRDFYGAVTADKAVKGVLITTSDFTAQAREFAERVGLELINMGRLQSLLTQYGMSA